MKKKNKEVGECGMCGKQTTKLIPQVKGYPHKKIFYCGCKGARCI